MDRLRLVLWFLLWPVSELFGRPPEAEEPLPRPVVLVCSAIGCLLFALAILGIAVACVTR